MAIDHAKSARPVSLPVPRSRPPVETIRRYTDDGPKHLHGPHWRPSVNHLLRTSVSQTAGLPLARRSAHADVRSPYLELPQELRDLIETYLSSADLLCLRQTCTEQYHGNPMSYINLGFDRQFTISLQVHSLRARLDRDHYHVVSRLEGATTMTRNHAACSFCHTLHPLRYFSEAQLAKPPKDRRCAFALRNYLVCGNYWMNPADMREVLETLTANDVGSDRPVLHDAPAHSNWLKSSQIQACMPIATVIENTSHIARDRSAFSASDHGLTLTHHFHLQSQPHHPLQRQQAIYRFDAALESPRRSVLAICPHLTVNSAGLLLGPTQNVGRGLAGKCPVEACGTSFGWFECKSETEGWKDLCFKVERQFGWLEELGGAFWRSQTAT